MSNAESALSTTREYGDPMNSTSPFILATMDNLFQSETAFTCMQPTDGLAALSEPFLPSLESVPSLLPDPLPLSQPISTSLRPWENQITCQTGLLSKHNTNVDATSGGTQQVTETRPRGRPRKDLSKKEATPTPNNNVDKYRAKNRRASARCRERERSQAAALEIAFQEQTKRNSALKQTTTALQEELFALQMQALQHSHCACKGIHNYNRLRAQEVAVAWDL